MNKYNNLRQKKWRALDSKAQLFLSSLYLPDFIQILEVPAYKEKVFVHQKYVVEGLSIAQIAAEIFVSKETIRKALNDHNIPIRSPHIPHERPAQVRYGQKRRGGTVVPNMAEKRVIRAIIEMREQGMTLRQIALCLDNIGVPTKKRGKKWHPEMVKRILGKNSSLEVSEGPKTQYKKGQLLCCPKY